MPELSGPIQWIEPSRTLGWLVAIPLVAAALLAGLGPLSSARRSGERGAMRLRIGDRAVIAVALVAMLLVLAVAIAEVVELASLPPAERFLQARLWPVARIGSIVVDFGLALDPLSAVLALVVTATGAFVHVYAAGYTAGGPGHAGLFARLQFLVFATLLVVLGDGFVSTFVGWEAVALATYALVASGGSEPARAAAARVFVTQRIADAALWGGVLVLFWGLAGGWLEGGAYQPDNLPRFAAVRWEPAPAGAAAGKGRARGPSDGVASAAGGGALGRARRLTMTTHPGARVFLDGAGVPLATSPFWRVPISAEPHMLRIETGSPEGGSRELSLGALGPSPVEPGEGERPPGAADEPSDVVIAPIGPTLVFHELSDQLLLRDARGRRPHREDLASRAAFGRLGIVAAASLLLFLGAAGKSSQLPLFGWLPGAIEAPPPAGALIQGVAALVPGAYLVARFSWLIAMSPTAGAILALAGAGGALAAALVAAFQHDAERVLAYGAIGQIGFVFAAMGCGAYAAGIVHLLTYAVCGTCLWLGAGSVTRALFQATSDPASTREERASRRAQEVGDLRTLGGLGRAMPLTATSYAVACAALSSAPVPLLAGFWSSDGILWRALNSKNLGPVAPELICGLLLAASAATSLYAWRSFFLVFTGEPSAPVSESPSAMTRVLVALAAGAVCAGALLGSPGRLFAGGGAPGWLETWLAPSFAAADVSFDDWGPERHEVAAAALFALAVGAFAFARARYGPRRPWDWAERDRRVPLFETLRQGLYLDSLHQALVVGPALRSRSVLVEMDRWVIDGVVAAVALSARIAAWASDLVDRAWIDLPGSAIAQGAARLGDRLRRARKRGGRAHLLAVIGGVSLFAWTLLRHLLLP